MVMYGTKQDNCLATVQEPGDKVMDVIPTVEGRVDTSLTVT